MFRIAELYDELEEKNKLIERLTKMVDELTNKLEEVTNIIYTHQHKHTMDDLLPKTKIPSELLDKQNLDDLYFIEQLVSNSTTVEKIRGLDEDTLEKYK